MSEPVVKNPRAGGSLLALSVIAGGSSERCLNSPRWAWSQGQLSASQSAWGSGLPTAGGEQGGPL